MTEPLEAASAAASGAGSALRRYLHSEAIRLPRALARRSPLRAAGCVLCAHLWLAVAILAGRVLPSGPARALAGFVLMLAAQRSLQTLVHHLSHQLLAKHRARNDALGNWLVAGFIGMRVQSYRRVHFVHHARNGSEADPEFIDVSALRSHGGLLRYALHFALGAEALALVRKYYFPTRGAGRAAAPAPRAGTALTGFAHIAFCQALLVALFVGVAHTGFFYAIWLYVALSWSPLLSRLRFLVEHPGKDDRTVTTRAPWYEVLFFAPYQFNYHFEHHLWPALPPYQLRRAHGHLAARGFFERHPEYAATSFVGSLRRLAAQR